MDFRFQPAYDDLVWRAEGRRMMRVRDRAISIIELLAGNAAGMSLIEVADTLDIPRSATHRVLADLKDAGYVRQDGGGERYLLTAKLVSVASTYLAGSGVTGLVQPILDRLAEATGELARLATISDDRLLWVARSQGARQALRYDPSDGTEVCLAVTAIGHAWLSCMSDDEALELVARQGFARSGFGPRAPRTLEEVIACVRRARTRGFATVTETNEAGTSALAGPVLPPGTSQPVAMLNIAGPTVRLSEPRMEEIAPMLLAAARELVGVCAGSPLFKTASRQSQRSMLPAAE
jgi:DNA-binding IclR family transcriptional regulator